MAQKCWKNESAVGGGKTDKQIAEMLAAYREAGRKEREADIAGLSRDLQTAGGLPGVPLQPTAFPEQTQQVGGESQLDPEMDPAFDAERSSPAGMGDYGPDISDPIKGPPQPTAQGAVSQTREQTPAAAQSRVSGIGTLTAPKIDLSNVGQMGESILKRSGLGSIPDPDKARMQARDESAAFMGRQRVSDRMQDYLKQLGALDAQQTDPAKLRKKNFLQDFVALRTQVVSAVLWLAYLEAWLKNEKPKRNLSATDY